MVGGVISFNYALKKMFLDPKNGGTRHLFNLLHYLFYCIQGEMGGVSPPTSFSRILFFPALLCGDVLLTCFQSMYIFKPSVTSVHEELAAHGWFGPCWLGKVSKYHAP